MACKRDSGELCENAVCWQGFPENGCPMENLEREKTMMSILLVAAVAILVWMVAV